jgi:hypothetical protein
MGIIFILLVMPTIHRLSGLPKAAAFSVLITLALW